MWWKHTTWHSVGGGILTFFDTEYRVEKMGGMSPPKQFQGRALISSME